MLPPSGWKENSCKTLIIRSSLLMKRSLFQYTKMINYNLYFALVTLRYDGSLSERCLSGCYCLDGVISVCTTFICPTLFTVSSVTFLRYSSSCLSRSGGSSHPGSRAAARLYPPSADPNISSYWNS